MVLCLWNVLRGEVLRVLTTKEKEEDEGKKEMEKRKGKKTEVTR